MYRYRRTLRRCNRRRGRQTIIGRGWMDGWMVGGDVGRPDGGDTEGDEGIGECLDVGANVEFSAAARWHLKPTASLPVKMSRGSKHATQPPPSQSPPFLLT